MVDDLVREYYGSFKSFGKTESDMIFARRQEMARKWEIARRISKHLIRIGILGFFYGFAYSPRHFWVRFAKYGQEAFGFH